MQKSDLYDALPDNESFIGNGRFGWVKKVRRRTDSRTLACKSVRFRDLQNSRATVERECAILSQLRHPNVVRQVDEQWRPNKVKIYMEYYEGGSLQGLINQRREQKSYLPEKSIWSVFFQMASALVYCHLGLKIDNDGRVSSDQGSIVDWKPILHRDIKPANIFLASDRLEDLGSVKLGDFGLGYILQDKTAPETYAGTSQYLAPEINRASPKAIHWTEHCDIFALGCTIYTLCSFETPFQYHMEAEDDSYEPITEQYSAALRELVSSCMSFSPEARPSAYRLFQVSHPYIKLSPQTALSNPAAEPLEKIQPDFVNIMPQMNETKVDRYWKRKPKGVLMSSSGPEGTRIYPREIPSSISSKPEPQSEILGDKLSGRLNPTPQPGPVTKNQSPETDSHVDSPKNANPRSPTPESKGTEVSLQLLDKNHALKASPLAPVEDKAPRSYEYFTEKEREKITNELTTAGRRKEIKLEDLKKFSKSLTLPPPKDLIPIMANNKRKQAEILAQYQEPHELAAKEIQRTLRQKRPLAPYNRRCFHAESDRPREHQRGLSYPVPRPPSPVDVEYKVTHFESGKGYVNYPYRSELNPKEALERAYWINPQVASYKTNLPTTPYPPSRPPFQMPK